MIFPQICLCSIMRNEAPRLKRMLSSVRPLISAFALVDTGSDDGSQMLARGLLRDLPGAVRNVPWIDFAQARTAAFDLARGLMHDIHPIPIDYFLVMDIDETVQIPSDFTFPPKFAESYHVIQRHANSGFRFSVTRLFRSDRKWSYRQPVHEYAYAPDATMPAEPIPLEITHHMDSHRRKHPRRFDADAAILRSAHEACPSDARICYYLAQSYRDSGDLALAQIYYARRAAMHNTWEEERWHAQFRAAQSFADLCRTTNQSDNTLAITSQFMAAFQSRPSRAEPPYHLAWFLLALGLPSQALPYAKLAALIPEPPCAGLFVETSIYGPGGDAANLAKKCRKAL